VITALDGGIATVTLHNPARANALTRPVYEQLCAAWESIEANPSVRAVVFTAAGERHFCVGADLSALKTQGALRRPGERWTLTWRQFGVTKPVVVAVNGTASGGGLGFVTDGDIVLAARHVKFSDTHVAVGQICGYGALRLVEIIGPSEAARIAVGGGVLTAQRAHELGLVNELHETPGDAVRAAVGIARKIAKASPTAVRETLTLLRGMAATDHRRNVLASADAAVERHMSHPDAEEGPKAWLDKREPAWSS
jgi:enoyl-CoA hydratase/carnithine racemase